MRSSTSSLSATHRTGTAAMDGRRPDLAAQLDRGLAADLAAAQVEDRQLVLDDAREGVVGCRRRR